MLGQCQPVPVAAPRHLAGVRILFKVPQQVALEFIIWPSKPGKAGLQHFVGIVHTPINERRTMSVQLLVIGVAKKFVLEIGPTGNAVFCTHLQQMYARIKPFKMTCIKKAIKHKNEMKLKQFKWLAAFMFIAAFAFAQHHGKGDPQERLERMNEHMKTELELTDAQYEDVKKINEEMVYAMAELKGSGDRDAAREVRDQYRDKLKAVLTEDQMKKAKELFEKRKKHRGKKHED